MRVLVIIPAYNEEKNIAKVITSLNNEHPSFDYIIINDGSTDGTREVCEQNNFNHINLPINLGIGGAVQCGYKYALKFDYDVVSQIDGDGQHNPEYLDDALRVMKDGNVDIVIGSRFINKEGFQSSTMRRFGIAFLSFLIKIVCGIKIYDVTSGYRIINKKMVKVFADNYADDFPEPEAIVAAYLHGGKIKEIPVVMKERETGKSSISPIKSIIYMIKVSLAILFYRITFDRRNINNGN